VRGVRGEVCRVRWSDKYWGGEEPEGCDGAFDECEVKTCESRADGRGVIRMQ
jgi:hypothetical protein